ITSEDVLKKRKAMNIIAKKHLANSSKDVSNGGIFGTMLQMVKYSNVGADVDITKIKIPPVLLKENYDLETYVQMYLTTSFLLTTPAHKREEMIQVFQEYGLDANLIGKIINDQNLLKINDGTESIEVIRF
ncbi:MAG: Phosphoribosylformylglycinamidine synthase 2, partial [Candidatus Lokiarchaeum sp. GC14_75]